MTSIVRFLTMINEYWTYFVIIVGVGIFLYKKIQSYMKMTTDQKINAAMSALKVMIFEMTAKAEIDWSEFLQPGSIKRAQVFVQIYERFPILKECPNSDEIVAEIDKIIDESLPTIRDKVTKVLTDNTVEEIITEEG